VGIRAGIVHLVVVVCLSGLVVRVRGYKTDMYCVSVRYELNLYICYVEESRPSLWSSGESSWLQNGEVLCFM
jgi:hypothetical protein